MAGTGGVRPGAGRKPTREKFATRVAAAEKKIADRLPQLVGNLLELADGVTVQETDKNGETRVYTRPPDFKANEYLLNRILGRPTESMDVTSGGDPVGVIGYEVVAPVMVKPDAE